MHFNPLSFVFREYRSGTFVEIGSNISLPQWWKFQIVIFFVAIILAFFENWLLAAVISASFTVWTSTPLKILRAPLQVTWKRHLYWIGSLFESHVKCQFYWRSLSASDGIYSFQCVNHSHPNPGRREKIKSNFYFHTSLWCLKRFLVP